MCELPYFHAFLFCIFVKYVDQFFYDEFNCFYDEFNCFYDEFYCFYDEFHCFFPFSLVPGVFGNQQQQHLGMIKAMLSSAMVDNNNPNIQALAVKATSAFILLHDNEPNIQKNFADFLPQFLQVIFLLFIICAFVLDMNFCHFCRVMYVFDY